MPVTTPPSITALPTPPDPADRSTFNTRAYPWSAALSTWTTQVGAVATNVSANATDAASSATAAASSASTASTHATTATTQAGIATTKAGEASTSASAASSSASTASTHAATATTQASIATTKAAEAAASAASIAGGPVTSVNGMTGVVTGLATATDITNERSAAATLTNKTLGSGTVIDAAVTGSDNLMTRVMLQDTGWDFHDSSTTNALDYVNGSVQRWAPNTGAQTLSITNWPPSGAMGELLIQGVNLGAATITWPTINWIKSDGTTTTTFSSNGVTLQTSGTDWVLLWTRDAGTTIFGKVVR